MNIKNTIKNVISNPAGFLLHNLGAKQTIAKNTLWLAIAEGITRFLKLFLIIYVARILGATEYGKFTFALAFISLFTIFADLGIGTITTREIARDKEKEKEFPACFSLKLVLSIGTLLLICIGSFFITTDPIIRGIIWILGVYILVNGFTGIIYAFFQARQKMEYEAWAEILQAMVLTGAGFFILFNFPSVQNLSLAYLFAAIIALIFVFIIFHFKIYHLKLDFNKKIWKNVLTLSWPLALGGVMSSICANTDSIMMGYWGQITEIGWYNASQRVVAVALIPATLIGSSFFPALSKFLGESKGKLQKSWNYFMEIMIFLSIPLIVGGIALAPKIIDLVYDLSYSPSILAFQILIVIGGIVILGTPFTHVLVVSNQQKKTFWIVVFGATLNVILNLILIPKYSLYGAAIASLIAGFLMFSLSFIFTLKFTFIRPFNLKLISTFLIAFISSIFMYLVISFPDIYNLYVIYIILIGILSYFLAFFILKKVLNYFIK